MRGAYAGALVLAILASASRVSAGEEESLQPEAEVDASATDPASAAGSTNEAQATTCPGCDPAQRARCSACLELVSLCNDEPVACFEATGRLEVDCETTCSDPEDRAPVEPDRSDEPTVSIFADFPYENDARGYIRSEPLDMDMKGWGAGRVSLEGGYAGSGSWRGGGHLQLSMWRFGLAADVTVVGNPERRHGIYVGSFVAPLAFVMRPRVFWEMGPGLTYVVPSDGRSLVGPSGSTRLDVFPAHPFVLSARVDLGRVRDDDPRFGATRPYTFTARGQVGVLVSRWELYGAYAYKLVGNRSAMGPVAGVRAWF